MLMPDNKLQPVRKRMLRTRILIALSIIGPGIIAANADNDAGGILGYSQAGAAYGYKLLWVLALVTISLGVCQEMGARMGAVTGKGLADLIREEYGVKITLFAMITLLAANFATTVSEFAGISAAVEMFSSPAARWVVVPLVAFAVWFLVTKGTYRKVEKFLLYASFLYLSYIAAAALAHPLWNDVVSQTFFPGKINWNHEYIFMIVNVVGTTITPWGQFYIQSSVRDKAIKKEEYPVTRADVLFGAFFTNLIAFFIIVACGATIYHSHAAVNLEDAGQVALALKPLAGPAAAILFAIGLFNASCFGAITVPISTAYAVSESLGWESGVGRRGRESSLFVGVFTVLIIVSALTVLLGGNNLTFLIILPNIVGGILLPIILILTLKLINNRRLMGSYINSFTYNVIAWATTLILIALAATLMLQSAGAQTSSPYAEETLSNGMRVIFYERHTAPLTAIDLWVRAGARSERPEQYGSAHFLEHTLFLGSTDRPGQGDDIAIENLGATLDASTGPDYAYIYTTVASEHYGKAVSIMADVAENAELPPAGIVKERGVILDELAQRASDPTSRLIDFLYDKAYPEQSYGHPPGGTPEAIQARNRTDLLSFYHRCYTPDRSVLVVVGDIDKTAAFKEAEKAFGSWKKPAGIEPYSAPKQLPLPGIADPMIQYSKLDGSRVALAFPAPAAKEKWSAAVADVAASLIYLDPAVALQQSHLKIWFTPRKDSGLFILTAHLDLSPNSSESKKLEREIGQAVSALRIRLAPISLLDQARERAIGQLDYDTETMAGTAEKIGYAAITGGDPPDIFRKRLKLITPEQVQQFAQQYLNPAHSFIGFELDKADGGGIKP